MLKTRSEKKYFLFLKIGAFGFRQKQQQNRNSCNKIEAPAIPAPAVVAVTPRKDLGTVGNF
jgi:Na+/melibiose symporter-like transporter